MTLEGLQIKSASIRDISEKIKSGLRLR